MRYSLITTFLILIFFIASNSAFDCNPYNGNCATCISQTNNSCGFCYATQLCEEVGTNGPLVGNCFLGWMTGAIQCPNCNQYSSCGDCNSSPYCGWCNANKNCVLTSQAISNNSCLLSHSCDCKKYLNCYECNQEGGCGWCSERQTCEDTKQTTCNLLAHTCPSCDKYSNCAQCVPQADCQWCVSSTSVQSCVASQNCTSSQRTKTCSSVCALSSKDCDTCTRQTGCGWCGSKKTCVGFDTTDNSCTLLTHSCPGQGKSFSGASFVGGMFLVIGIGLLIGAGFFAYRFFQKRQSNYTEV